MTRTQRSARQVRGQADKPQDIGLRSAWFEPSVHSAYYQIYSKLLSARSMAVARPFTGQARLLPLLDFLPLLDAVDAPRNPRAGIDIGFAIPAAAHGAKGLAALASSTLQEALETVARYGPIRNRMFGYRCHRADGDAVLAIPSRLSFGDYGRFLQNAVLYATLNIFRAIADEEAMGQAVIGLPWPEPVVPEEPVPGKMWSVRHGTKELEIRFPLRVSQRPLETSDPDLYQRLCRAGEEELTKLEGNVSAKVRHLIHRRQPHWPTLDDTAGALGLSRRTLVRRLEDEGLGYQDLLDEARNELACWYLRHTAMPLSEISEELGFSDQANFSRGFRRWQGLAPREYRLSFRPSASSGSAAAGSL
jgi:AraC-like DNA-binding protein